MTTALASKMSGSPEETGLACGPTGAGVVATTTTRSAPSDSAGLIGAFSFTPPSMYQPRCLAGASMCTGRNATGIAADAITCGLRNIVFA